MLSKTAIQKLSFGSKFFQFKSDRAYLLLGSLLLANGIGHGYFVYCYYKDPKGTIDYLQNLAEKWIPPPSNQNKSLENKHELSEVK